MGLRLRRIAADRRARLALAVGAAGVVFASCRPLRTADLVFDSHPAVLKRVATPEPMVALTLDDGPDPETTPALLALLERHGARATFFLLGERVSGNEVWVEAIARGGHEVANHGTRDRPAVDLSPGEFERDLLRADAVLAPFAEPRWYRPGSGWYDEAMLRVAARHGYRVALGSVYPLDAQHPFVGVSARWLRWDVDAGDIIVLHADGKRGERTFRILEDFLPWTRERGLAVVTLGELVASGEGARNPEPPSRVGAQEAGR